MFTKRTSKPSKGNKFYTRKPKGYNTCVKGKPTDECNALANCVGYVEGRINEAVSDELGEDVFKYDTLYCNAENFIEKALTYKGVIISDVPVKGGIMVWQKGDTLSGDDGAGHVEFVEEVTYKKGTIEVESIYDSASSYGGTAFFNVKRTNANGRWGLGSKYKFRGCIVFPELAYLIPKKPEPKPEPVKPKPEPVKPKPVKPTIKPGDYVIVNGRGRASSKGTGATTRNYKNKKMKVIRVVDNKYPYGLNQYGVGVTKQSKYITAWFDEDSVKKV